MDSSFCLFVCFFVLVNGTSQWFLSSWRGLRHGSSLGKMLSTAVSGGLFGLFVGSKNDDGIDISHLLFADDTLIFRGVDPDHLCHLCCLFLCFEAVSGLEIHLAKPKLVHVGNVNNVEGLAGILGCRVS
jgi:hypothetical protein